MIINLYKNYYYIYKYNINSIMNNNTEKKHITFQDNSNEYYSDEYYDDNSSFMNETCRCILGFIFTTTVLSLIIYLFIYSFS
jgi:hypothetical protein